MADIYDSSKDLGNGKKSKGRGKKKTVSGKPPLTETGRTLRHIVSRKRKRKISRNPLSAFYYFPAKMTFETKDKEEEIVLLLRRHFLTNVGWIATATALSVAPFLLDGFPLFNFLPEQFKVVAAFIWYLIVTAYVLESFLTWFFDVNILTDERMVDIDFHNLIHKTVSDAKIDNIQDVSYEVGGAIRSVFNYGNVLIQTAAERTMFVFTAVPNPERVAKILQDLMLEEEQEKIEGRVR